MNEYKVNKFLLSARPTEEQLNDVAELNLILKQLGVELSIGKLQGCSSSSDRYSLTIKCDTDLINQKRKRGAGRKQKPVSVAEIEERLQHGESVTDVANDLGISRATLYRRLKNQN